MKNKPAELVRLSPKATVPVLVLPDGRVLDESLDIMIWCTELPGRAVCAAPESGPTLTPNGTSNVTTAAVVGGSATSNAGPADVNLFLDVGPLVHANDTVFAPAVTAYRKHFRQRKWEPGSEDKAPPCPCPIRTPAPGTLVPLGPS